MHKSHEERCQVNHGLRLSSHKVPSYYPVISLDSIFRFGRSRAAFKGSLSPPQKLHTDTNLDSPQGAGVGEVTLVSPCPGLTLCSLANNTVFPKIKQGTHRP